MRAVDRIRETAWQDMYWVLVREPDRTTWTLRHLDDRTGALSEPVHHSHPVGPDSYQAVGWAQGLVDVESWRGIGDDDAPMLIDETHALVREIGRRPRRGRSIVVRREADRHHPSRMLVRVYERWDASGRLSDPLRTMEADQFADDDEVRAWASKVYGLDPAGWRRGAADGEYIHS
jgi:hypothetical protein